MLYIVQKAPKRGKTHLMTAIMVVEAKNRADAVAQAQSANTEYFDDEQGDPQYTKTRADPLVIGQTYVVG